MNVQKGPSITGVRAVPPEFKKRKRFWIYNSLWLNHVD